MSYVYSANIAFLYCMWLPIWRIKLYIYNCLLWSLRYDSDNKIIIIQLAPSFFLNAPFLQSLSPSLSIVYFPIFCPFQPLFPYTRPFLPSLHHSPSLPPSFLPMLLPPNRALDIAERCKFPCGLVKSLADKWPFVSTPPKSLIWLNVSQISTEFTTFTLQCTRSLVTHWETATFSHAAFLWSKSAFVGVFFESAVDGVTLAATLDATTRSNSCVRPSRGRIVRRSSDDDSTIVIELDDETSLASDAL